VTFSHVLKNLDARGFFQIKPGLERMERISRALGHPERRWASLHIAGTNGKGSVSATLESVLRHAGYKTGLYTSPHLVSITERIQVNGRPIPTERFAACGSQLIATEKKLGIHLTYFEFVTALAFLYFSQECIDVGVIECGMGGRWDATNIIPRPAVSVVTSIGLDHMAWLGNTLGAITQEKAGIIKENGQTVSGVHPDVQSIMSKAAKKHNNRFFSLNTDFRGIPRSADWQKPLQSWSYYELPSPRRKPGTSPKTANINDRLTDDWAPAFAGVTPIIFTPLMGRHQIDNGAISLKVICLLKEQGWTIAEKAIFDGFKNVKWPGRLQLFHKTGHPDVLLDGAHNPHAMTKLLATLKSSAFAKKRFAFIFSAFSDKDVAGMARKIGPVAERIYLCEMSGERRSTLTDLSKAFAQFKSKSVLCSGGIDEAIARAWHETAQQDYIVATGSLMLVGEILKKKRVFND
jgi:dihydrofolate synthase/folylpolyglutamate synthase